MGRHPFDLTHDPIPAIVLTFVAVCVVVLLMVYPEKLQMWWSTYLNNFGAIERVRRPDQAGSGVTTRAFRLTGLIIAVVFVFVFVLIARSR